MAGQAFHLRSASLPSRSHPATTRSEEKLHRLRTSPPSSSADAVCEKLRKIGDTYNSIDELLRLPGNWQSISLPDQVKWVEEELESSLCLIDLAGAIRDGLATTMEHLQDLQLTLRRKDCSNTKAKYHLRSSNKNIANSLRSLQKRLESGRKRQIGPSVSAMLVEARQILMSSLKTVCSFMVEVRAKTSAGKRPFLIKMLRKRRVANEVNEVDNGDEAFADLCSKVREVEDGLESLFRSLLRNRVALLNILSF